MGIITTFSVKDYNNLMIYTIGHIFTALKEIYLEFYYWPHSNISDLKDMSKSPLDIEEPQILLEPTHITKWNCRYLIPLSLKSIRENQLGIRTTDALRINKYWVWKNKQYKDDKFENIKVENLHCSITLIVTTIVATGAKEKKTTMHQFL